MTYRKNIIQIYLYAILLLSTSFINAFDGIPNESTYCATWSSSQYLTEPNNMPPIPLSNNSIRQIVHISVSSPTIRLKLSNIVGDSNLEIKGVSIANSVSQGSGEIDLLTLTQITFDRKESVVIPAYSEVYSDPFYYPLKVQSEVAISIYFGEVPSKLTSHAGSRTFSFIEQGNKINEKKFSPDNKTAHWYIISAIEVSSYPTKKAVVCFGDSITDGRGSTDDKQNRWTDVLSKKLYLNDGTINLATVNAGIGATLVTTNAQERFERDVINITGSTYIIVLYGVNDVLFSNSKAENIIEAYKALITKAHKNNKFIFGGTILPFGTNSNYNEEREKVRQEVNNWIRNAGKDKEGFDYCFDFDKLTRDSNDEKSLSKECDSGDGLHPSPEGYVKMVEAIDNLKVFTVDPEFEGENDLEIKDKIGLKFKLDFNLEKDEEVKIKVEGRSKGSYGFRILTNDDEGNKTSDYYYTGKIENGSFEINTSLKVNEISNYLVIRRPMSTINIDKIILSNVEIEAKSGKKSFSPKKEGKFIE